MILSNLERVVHRALGISLAFGVSALGFAGRFTYRSHSSQHDCGNGLLRSDLDVGHSSKQVTALWRVPNDIH